MKYLAAKLPPQNILAECKIRDTAGALWRLNFSHIFAKRAPLTEPRRHVAPESPYAELYAKVARAREKEVRHPTSNKTLDL